jgi:ABC-2 type transport system ATP-binding protein
MNAVIEQSEAVIRCDRLTVGADAKTILDGITLDIPRGAVVGIVGRNGAGKSTLLRAMVGLAAPEVGTATLLGQPSLGLDDDARARLGYVAQTPDLFEWLTVQEHLDLIGSAYPTWDGKHCLQLAFKLDLPLGQKVAKLSGGDKQKLAVVLALAHRPEVLVLDEPVSNLDPMTRRDFMRALFQDGLQDGGQHTTVVISSHLLNDLERVVTHLAFIREGSLQLFEPWDAILEHLRLIPRDSESLSPTGGNKVLWRGSRHWVIDTRDDAATDKIGQACTLDQLFIALNE